MNSLCFKIFNSMNFIASNGAGPATDEGSGSSWLSQASVDVFSFLINIVSSMWSFLGKSIMTLVYLVVKFALNIVDFLQFFVGKLIGLSTWGSNSVADASFENSDIIFKFLSSPTVRKVFIAVLVLSIVLLILFTVIAIIRQQYLSTVDEKQSNGIGLFVKRIGKSLVLFLTVPIMVIFGILGSNAILAGISSAFKLGSGITLGGQVFVASSYEANRYRSYANADVRVPMYYRNAVDVTELNGNISDYCVMSYKDFSLVYGDNTMQGMQPYLLVTRHYNTITGSILNVKYDGDPDDESTYHRPNEKFIFKGCEFLLSEEGFKDGKYKLWLNGNGEEYRNAVDEGNWQYIQYDLINLNGVNYLNGCEVHGSGENAYILIDYSEKDDKIPNISSDDDVKNAYTSWNYNDKFANVNLSFNATRDKQTKSIDGVSCYVNSNNSTYSEYENFTPLRNEYYVMADVIDFAIESGKELFFLPIKYAGANFESTGNDLKLNLTEKSYIKKSADTGIGFYVNYYDETDFYKYSPADDERDGAVYVVCMRTTQGFIPLTQGNSAFKSSYLSSTYKGMIIARGLLDDSSSAFASGMFTTYCPTFIKNVENLSNANLQYYSGLEIEDNKIKSGASVIQRLPGGTAENTLGNSVSVSMRAYAESGVAVSAKNKSLNVDFYVQTETNTLLYDMEGVTYKDVYYDCVFYGKTGAGDATNSALLKAIIVETVKKEGDAFVTESYSIKEYLFADENWTRTYTAAATQNSSAILSGGKVVVNDVGYLYFCRSELNRNIIGPIDINLLPLDSFRAHWALFHGGSSSLDRGVVAYRLQNGSFMLDYNFNESTGIAMEYIYDAIDLNVIVLVFCTILLFQVLVKTVYGLINRIYEIVLLFLIMPGFVSMIPLDDGAKFTKWKEMLIKKVLATYGITIGINLFFILAPIIKSATQIFSNGDIPAVLQHVPLFSDAVFLNRIVYLLFLLVALTLFQSAPAIIAELLGAGEVMKEGGAVQKNVKDMVDDVRDTVSGQKAQKYMKDFKENAMGFLPGSAFYGDKLENAANNLRNRISNRFAKKPLSDDAERERLEREFDEAHANEGDFGPDDGEAQPPTGGPPPPDNPDDGEPDDGVAAEEPITDEEPEDDGVAAEEPITDEEPEDDGVAAEEPTTDEEHEDDGAAEEPKLEGEELLMLPPAPENDGKAEEPKLEGEELLMLPPAPEDKDKAEEPKVDADENKAEEPKADADENKAEEPKDDEDYYSILGVDRNATQEEIKAAYRKRVKETHPDLGGDLEESKKVNEAGSVLRKEDKRAEYDAMLAEKEKQNASSEDESSNKKEEPKESASEQKAEEPKDGEGESKAEEPDGTLESKVENLESEINQVKFDIDNMKENNGSAGEQENKAENPTVDVESEVSPEASKAVEESIAANEESNKATTDTINAKKELDNISKEHSTAVEENDEAQLEASLAREDEETARKLSEDLDPQITSAKEDNDKKQSELSYFKGQESEAQQAYDTKYQSLFDEEKEELLKKRNADNPNRTKKDDLYQSEKQKVDSIVKKKMAGSEEENKLNEAKEFTSAAQEEADNSQFELDLLNEQKAFRNSELNKRSQTREEAETKAATSQEKVDDLSNKKDDAQAKFDSCKRVSDEKRQVAHDKELIAQHEIDKPKQEKPKTVAVENNGQASQSESQSTGALKAKVTSLESALRQLQSETYDLRKAQYVKENLGKATQPSAESRQNARSLFGARLTGANIDHSADNASSVGAGMSERIRAHRKKQNQKVKPDADEVNEKPVKEPKPKKEGTRAERKKAEWIAKRENLENEGAKLNMFEKVSTSFSPAKRQQAVADKTTKKIEKAQAKESKYQTKIDSRQAGIERRTERIAKVVGAGAIVRNTAKDIYGKVKEATVETIDELSEKRQQKVAAKAQVKEIKHQEKMDSKQAKKERHIEKAAQRDAKVKAVMEKVQQNKGYQRVEKFVKSVREIPQKINDYNESMKNAQIAGAEQAAQNTQAKVQNIQDKQAEQRTLRETDTLRSTVQGNQVGHTKDVKKQSREHLKNIWNAQSSSEVKNAQQSYTDSSLNEAYRQEKQSYDDYVKNEHTGTSSQKQATKAAKKMNMSRSGAANAGRRRSSYKTDEELRKNKKDSDS